jgi:hypothetical protein
MQPNTHIRGGKTKVKKFIIGILEKFMKVLNRIRIRIRIRKKIIPDPQHCFLVS